MSRVHIIRSSQNFFVVFNSLVICMGMCHGRAGTTGEPTAQSQVLGRGGNARRGDSAGQTGSCGTGQTAESEPRSSQSSVSEWWQDMAHSWLAACQGAW